MAESTDGAKQKLTITRWSVQHGAVRGTPFTAMINPAGYDRTQTFAYSKGTKQRVIDVMSESLKLNEMVFDGTGVVGSPTGGEQQDVTTQLEKLRNVAYVVVDDDKVVRPIVELLWGSLYFLGRLQSMDVKYTLFKPNGQPLRARVVLTFCEYEENYDTYKPKTSNSNAGFTKQIQVIAGASLPLMCFDVYKDPNLYQEVARINGLTSCRKPPEGTDLMFPSKKNNG